MKSKNLDYLKVLSISALLVAGESAFANKTVKNALGYQGFCEGQGENVFNEAIQINKKGIDYSSEQINGLEGKIANLYHIHFSRAIPSFFFSAHENIDAPDAFVPNDDTYLKLLQRFLTQARDSKYRARWSAVGDEEVYVNVLNSHYKFNNNLPAGIFMIQNQVYMRDTDLDELVPYMDKSEFFAEAGSAKAKIRKQRRGAIEDAVWHYSSDILNNINLISGSEFLICGNLDKNTLKRSPSYLKFMLAQETEVQFLKGLVEADKKVATSDWTADFVDVKDGHGWGQGYAIGATLLNRIDPSAAPQPKAGEIYVTRPTSLNNDDVEGAILRFQ